MGKNIVQITIPQRPVQSCVQDILHSTPSAIQISSNLNADTVVTIEGQACVNMELSNETVKISVRENPLHKSPLRMNDSERFVNIKSRLNQCNRKQFKSRPSSSSNKSINSSNKLSLTFQSDHKSELNLITSQGQFKGNNERVEVESRNKHIDQVQTSNSMKNNKRFTRKKNRIIGTRNQDQMVTRRKTQLRANSLMHRFVSDSKQSCTKRDRTLKKSKYRRNNVNNKRNNKTDQTFRKYKDKRKVLNDLHKESEELCNKMMNKRSRTKRRFYQKLQDSSTSSETVETPKRKRSCCPIISLPNQIRKSQRNIERSVVKYRCQFKSYRRKSNCYFFNFNGKKIWLNDYYTCMKSNLNCSVLLKPIQFQPNTLPKDFNYENDQLLENIYNQYFDKDFRKTKEVRMRQKTISVPIKETPFETYMRKLITVLNSKYFPSYRKINVNKIKKETINVEEKNEVWKLFEEVIENRKHEENAISRLVKDEHSFVNTLQNEKKIKTESLTNNVLGENISESEERTDANKFQMFRSNCNLNTNNKPVTRRQMRNSLVSDPNIKRHLNQEDTRNKTQRTRASPRNIEISTKTPKRKDSIELEPSTSGLQMKRNKVTDTILNREITSDTNNNVNRKRLTNQNIFKLEQQRQMHLRQENDFIENMKRKYDLMNYLGLKEEVNLIWKFSNFHEK